MSKTIGNTEPAYVPEEGVEFATFHLAADLNLRVLTPWPGDYHAVKVEIVSGLDYKDGDTRKGLVIHLPKGRARAIGSALLGAAAEL